MDRRSLRASPAVVSLFGTFFFGLFVHMFALVNVLHNYDDITTQPSGLGAGLISGRWFLELLAELFDKRQYSFNLPWVNGLLFIFLISLAAALLVEIFHIQDKRLALLPGAAIISFPTVTSTMIFRYTAPAYGLSLFFGTLAVYTFERYRYGFVFSICLIAMSIGIYQAYFPFTVTLFLMLLLKQALEQSQSPFAIIKHGLYCLLTLISGLLLYLLVLKLMLTVRNMELISYQGISSMGKQLSLDSLPALIRYTYRNFFSMADENGFNLASSPLLKLSYKGIGTLTFLQITVFLLRKGAKFLSSALIVFLILLLPLGINLMTILGNSATHVYTLMVMSFSLILLIPLILPTYCEGFSSFRQKLCKGLRSCSIGFVVLVVVCNAYYANVNYSSLYFTNRQMENYVNTITAQIHMTEGYTVEKKLVLLGNVSTQYFNNYTWGWPHIYGEKQTAKDLANDYSKLYWFDWYTGHLFSCATEQEAAYIRQLPQVQEMPCWPDYGSIKIIDSYAVVKLSD